MRKTPFILIIVYSFSLLTGRAYGIGEKIISLGAASSWDLMETRLGISEAPLIRPHPVLVLACQTGLAGENSINNELMDLRLSFDEGRPGAFADSRGHYDVFASPDLAAAAPPLSRAGNGAALFSGKAGTGPLVLRPRGNALFAPGNRIRDFSIEFWLYPLNTAEGEQILLLSASVPSGRDAYIDQHIQCAVSKSRLFWTFSGFFFSPGSLVQPEGEYRSLSFSGPPLLPKTWSHHLIRFDADLGLLEYLADGRLEALVYATSTGREGGEVYTPVIGEDCRLSLGSRFSGMIDEFCIHRLYLEKAALAMYPEQGGRAESRTLDLGYPGSRLLKIEAFGGRTSNSMGKVSNEYRGNGALVFPDHGELQLFVRTSDSSYRWNEVPWVPVDPGTELPGSLRGRYVQIAADFYPGADGDSSPYLAELTLTYRASEPPPPPALLTAAAKNGAVELSWKASISRESSGYLVYYGTARGEYFGDHAILGSAVCPSPIDVGNRTSVRIEGLKNGTLYYFVVAAYAGSTALEPGRLAIEPGEFSREIAARPLLHVSEDG